MLELSRVFATAANLHSRSFSTMLARAKNRIYTPVRSEVEFSDLLLLSTSSSIPLLTLWTTSWCSPCQQVKPLIYRVIEEGVGEEEGGIKFAEVEMDAPDIGQLGFQYSITSTPTLLAFSRGEAQLATKLTGDQMRSPDLLKSWIRQEARRRGRGSSGGGLFPQLFKHTH